MGGRVKRRKKQALSDFEERHMYVFEQSCVLCGSTQRKKISDQLRGTMGEKYQMRPHRCGQCGLVFLHPLMSESAEKHFYQHEFRQIYHGEGYNIEDFHKRGFVEAARRKQKCKEQNLLKKTLLEVGSATGYFLELVKGDVSSCVGVEPDERARDHANQLGVRTVSDIADIGEERFDTIVLFHVLEHVRAPATFLKLLKDKLQPGGSIVVEVPNVDDVLLTRYTMAEFDAFYWHPAHNYYFSKDTLLLAAEQAGLIASVYPIQRYSLSNHLNWAVNRKPGGNRDFDGMISVETDMNYKTDLCNKFLCDTLWMVATKVE